MNRLFINLLIPIGMLILLPSLVWGVEIAGVSVPERQTLPDGRMLQLNGAGPRRKFFFTIYVAALYLPEPQEDAELIIESRQPKRVTMGFVHSKVERAKMAQAWREGFERNHDGPVLERLADRIDRFVSQFGDLHRGDRVQIDLLPGSGTRVSINGTVGEVIPGADFAAALLRIWLGSEPVSDRLKAQMLGG